MPCKKFQHQFDGILKEIRNTNLTAEETIENIITRIEKVYKIEPTNNKQHIKNLFKQKVERDILARIKEREQCQD